MKDVSQHPEAQQENKGILGTIRDWVTPEYSDTQKSTSFLTVVYEV